MNILKVFTHFFTSLLSRVHLVRRKRQVTITWITKEHDTSVGTSEKGPNAKKGQTDES